MGHDRQVGAAASVERWTYTPIVRHRIIDHTLVSLTRTDVIVMAFLRVAEMRS